MNQFKVDLGPLILFFCFRDLYDLLAWQNLMTEPHECRDLAFNFLTES